MHIIVNNYFGVDILQIDIIGNNTVKITLNKADMLCYDFRFDSVDCNSPQMKQFIVEMVNTIKDRKNIDLDTKKLYIEAFPKKDGGCLIYISPIEETISPRNNSNLSYSTIIADFFDVESVISISEILNEKFSCFIQKSSLYSNNKKYRMIADVYSKAENKIGSIISEFGEIVERSPFEYAATCEYYNCIVTDNAVKLLSGL